MCIGGLGSAEKENLSSTKDQVCHKAKMMKRRDYSDGRADGLSKI